jgi:SAM-dependent methyltransferase
MKRSLFSKNWLVHRIGDKYISGAARFARGLTLDVGCGEKPYQGVYSPRVQSYLGVDLPGSNTKKVDVYADALSLPFRDGTFQTVLSFQVLEHVKEPSSMIAEIARVLSTGGYAVVSAPHIWGLHEVPRDYFRFTRYGLEHLLAKSGLEVVEIKAMAGYWVTAGTRFCYYLETLRKRALSPLFGLTFFIVQAACFFLDRLYRLETDTWNYIAIGRKPC